MNRAKGVIVIEGHVQGLANTRALGKAGIPVVVVDVRKCVAASSKYCKNFFYCPPFLEDSFAEFLLALCQKEGLYDWLLMPSNDHAVYTLSRNRSLLEKVFKLTVPELSALDKIYDKVQLLTIAQQQQVDIPITHCFKTVDEQIPSALHFPILTKGRNGLSFYKKLGKKAYLAHDINEFAAQLHEIASLFSLQGTFTQELIPFDGNNKTISFTAFCIEGVIQAYWMGVKLREHPLQFGTATFTESVYEEACLVQSTKLLHALGYTGVCEVEFLFDPRDEKYKLIEINPRTWLWVGHAIACGINFPLYLYNYVNGIKTLYPQQYKLGVKWRNPFSDCIFSGQALLKRQINRRTLKHQNQGKIINALWEKGDTKPFYRYGMMMINFLKNR